MSFDFNGWSETFEDYERAAFGQVTGFKRCHLSAPIYIDYVSTGFVNILGYTPEALHELFNDESVGYVHPDDAAEYRDLLNRFGEQEMTATFHYRVICRDGSVKYLNDTMKSVKLNGEMWGFSYVSDATAMKSADSLSLEAFLKPNALVSLCFDMQTHKRIVVQGDKSIIPFSSDASLEDVYSQLVVRTHPQDASIVSENLTSWHLRDSLSFECRMYATAPDGRTEYRWMCVTTVCFLTASGGRTMVLNVEDVNDRKLSEMQAVKTMGCDWLTGLLNVSAFHALCLRRGFSDGKGVEFASNGLPTFASLRAVDYSFYADFYDDGFQYRPPSEEYDFRAIVALCLDTAPVSGGKASFHDYYAAVKRASNALRLAVMDGDIVSRVDTGLFFIAPMTKLSRSEFIDRARILLSAMMVPLESGATLSAYGGIALCPVGETYENAVALAMESLEEAMREDDSCVVFRSAQDHSTSFVQPVFGQKGFVRKEEDRLSASVQTGEDVYEDAALFDDAGQFA